MSIRETHFRNVEDFFQEGLFVMRGKNEDYAEESDPFSNFRFAADAAGVTVNQVFLVLQGIKLARLKQLLVGNKTPNNESVNDTMGDASNYYAIQSSYNRLLDSTDPTYAYAGAPEIEDESSSDFYDVPDVDEEPEFVTPAPPEEMQTVYEFTDTPPSPSPAERIRDFFGFGRE